MCGEQREAPKGQTADCERPRDPGVYPVAAVTNHHKLGGLRQHIKTDSLGPRGQKSETGRHQGRAPSKGSRGGSFLPFPASGGPSPCGLLLGPPISASVSNGSFTPMSSSSNIPLLSPVKTLLVGLGSTQSHYDLILKSLF